MIIDFLSFLFTFPWRPYGPGHKQANHKGVEKYIFHCFGDDWVLSKMRFWKINQIFVSITWCQSLGLYSRALLEPVYKQTTPNSESV